MPEPKLAFVDQAREPRTRPELLQWFRELDTYSNETVGVPSVAKQIREARERLSVIVGKIS